jgi:hypothetical protein
VNGFSGAVCKKFSKLGKAHTFIKTHAASKYSGEAKVLSGANADPSPTESNRKKKKFTAKVVEPSFSTFIGGLLPGFKTHNFRL